jgi:hypothetical protein
LLEKSKKKIKNSDNKKLIVVINNAIALSLYVKLDLFTPWSELKGLHTNRNTPIRGINNNENNIIKKT